jgi:tetratricopeptide (TPR) repeat protein
MTEFPNKLRILFALVIVFLSACATTVTISGDLSPEELIQRAQEASDRNRYNVALQYYEALLDRNRDSIDLVITAKYEIAFIHYKQKKYDEARAELTEVLEYYNTPDEELLPQQYKRLAQKVLEENIPEKENSRIFKKKTPEPEPEPQEEEVPVYD